MVDFTPYEHFKMKLLERHNLDINKFEYRELSKMIVAHYGWYKLPKNRWTYATNTRIPVRFDFKGKKITAIFSKKFRRLITVISKDWTAKKGKNGSKIHA